MASDRCDAAYRIGSLMDGARSAKSCCKSPALRCTHRTSIQRPAQSNGKYTQVLPRTGQLLATCDGRTMGGPDPWLVYNGCRHTCHCFCMYCLENQRILHVWREMFQSAAFKQRVSFIIAHLLSPRGSMHVCSGLGNSAHVTHKQEQNVRALHIPSWSQPDSTKQTEQEQIQTERRIPISAIRGTHTWQVMRCGL